MVLKEMFSIQRFQLDLATIRFYQKLTPELISLEERNSLYPEEEDNEKGCKKDDKIFNLGSCLIC